MGPISLVQHPGSQKGPISLVQHPGSQKGPISLVQHPGSQKGPISSVQHPVSQKGPISSVQHPGSQKGPIGRKESTVSFFILLWIHKTISTFPYCTLNFKKSINSVTQSISAWIAVLLCPTMQVANDSYLYFVATRPAARKRTRDLKCNDI